MSSKSHRKARRARLGRVVNALGLILVPVLAITVLYSYFSDDARDQRQAVRQSIAQPRAPQAPSRLRQVPERTGEPWEYDAAADVYWDPRPGHLHWHPGPAPPLDERPALLARP